MKVDFIGKGLTFSLDKVPRFIYINEEGEGCGQVYFNGVRTKGLVDVNIKAHTIDEDDRHPLRYRVEYYDKEKGKDPQVISNMKEGLILTLKVDMAESEAALDCFREILNDSRIPEAIREEYGQKFISVIKSAVVVRSGSGRIVEMFKEDNHENK